MGRIVVLEAWSYRDTYWIADASRIHHFKKIVQGPIQTDPNRAACNQSGRFIILKSRPKYLSQKFA